MEYHELKENVIIVMGPPCSGKSTFIQENFPDKTVIDLKDFQRDIGCSYEEIMQSYIKCKDSLMVAIQEGKPVVLEHTLLKRKRRPMYVEAIKEVTDAPIYVYVMQPSPEKVTEYYQKENISEDFYYGHQKLLEIPEKEEGFEEIYIIN